MNDLVTHSTRKSYNDRLNELLKALLWKGLKISPTKSKLVTAYLQYMRNTMLLERKQHAQNPYEILEAMLFKT